MGPLMRIKRLKKRSECEAAGGAQLVFLWLHNKANGFISTGH